MVERQELHCHECDGYVQFDIDLEIDGNHILECPKCGHQHCRIVQKGKISDSRWDARNCQGVDSKGKPIPAGSLCIKGIGAPKEMPDEMIGPNGLPIIKVSASTLTWSKQSTYTIYEKKGNGSIYLYMAWSNAQ